MNIVLKPNQEAFIRAKVESGQYQTVDEAIEAALHLLEEQDKSEEQWIIETREQIDEGVASLERGEGIDGETFVSQLLEKLKQTKEAQK
jgi:antitoxin ParD1/3/4